MEQIVHLALGQHCHLGNGDLELVHLERDVVTMEISAMKDIGALPVHNRIVIDSIDLILKHLTCTRPRIIHRSEYLRHASERVIRLHFLLEHMLLRLMEKFYLTAAQHSASVRQRTHQLRNTDLPGMMLQFIEHIRHEIIVGRSDFIHQN